MRSGTRSTAAALSTTGPGARGALPDDDAVRAVLPRVPDPSRSAEAGFRRRAAGHSTAMTEPDEQQHTAEPAEGGDPPGTGTGGRTPHPDDPAEGPDTEGGADTP